MGMIKWTGRGFELFGKILSNKMVEEWLKEHGKELIVSIFENITAKWFLGKTRAVRKAKKQLLKEVNGNELFRKSLNHSLNRLPNIIRRLALDIIKVNIEVLTKKCLWTKLIIVPRAVVLDSFKIKLTEELGQASELRRFEEFPKMFLRRQAEQAEETFLDTLKKNKKPVVVSNNGMILMADDQFDWHLENVLGHYYFGYKDSSLEDFNKKKDRKEFIKDIKEILDEKMIELGKLTKEEINNTIHFFKK